MTNISVNVWLIHTGKEAEIKAEPLTEASDDGTWILRLGSATVFLNAESAARIIEALRPLVPASFGVEPEEPEHQEMTDEEAEIYCQQEELWEKDILG